MARGIQHAKDLQGLSIYRDSKNRAIYSDFITGKKGYIITDSTLPTFNKYELRLPLALCVFVLLYFLVKLNLFISIGIGLAIYLVISILFYTKFLNELTETENFEKKKEGFLDITAETKPTASVIISVVVAILLGVLSIINGSRYDDIYIRYLNYIIAIVAFIYALMMLVVCVKKIKLAKKNK